MIRWDVVLLGGAAVAAAMLVLWLVQRRTRDAGIVDLGWTLGVGTMGVLLAATGGGHPARRAVLASIAAIWSARLAWHLWTDRLRGKDEDGRYRELRERWRGSAQRNFLLFFQFQAVLVVILAVPYAAAAANVADAPGWREALAASLATVSIAGETVADRQLARWRADPGNRGRTCRLGFWRYSRHPNYFFEWLHWWACAVLAVPAFPLTGVPLPLLLALTGPAIMILLILKVTGIPPTEARALRSRGDDYRRYQAETSAFFPWFPGRT